MARLNASVVERLLGTGAIPNLENNEGQTAVDMAETEEIAEMLRAAGA